MSVLKSASVCISKGMHAPCIPSQIVISLFGPVCFQVTPTEASCVCCALAIDKDIREFEKFLERKQKRRFV